MRNAIRKAVLAAVAAAGTVAAPMAGATTLAEALTKAYVNSGLIDQNRAVLRAADEDVAQAISQLRPVVNWQGSIVSRWSRNGSIQPVTGTFTDRTTNSHTASLELVSSITLYAGGSNLLRVDQAKESVLAARAGLVSVEQQVLFRAVQAFMEVRRATETVGLRQNNVRVIGQELEAARDRFEVGEITRTDVALAEARLASARSALAGALGNLEIAFEEYRAVVGHEPGNLVPPRNLPRLPATEEEAKAIAVRQHPDILRVQRLVTVSELGIAIARAALKPTVDLRGTVGVTETFNSPAFQDSASIQLNFGGPIYSGGRLESLIRQAAAQRDQNRAQLHSTVLEIRQRVGEAYARLAVSRASTEAFEAQVRAATVAFRGIREEAELGARTTLDVLDAEQELQDARTSLVSAQVDETIAAYAALAAMGLLTTKDLQLPVPQYDPAAYYVLVKDAPSAVSRQGRELDRVMEALGKN